MKQKDVVSMEMLPINNDAGQSYGYILYSTKIPKSSKKVTIHEAADRVTVSFLKYLNFSAIILLF